VRLNGRILLAEDSPVNRRLVALHLRRAGAVVDEAEDGRVALEMLTRAEAVGEPYDLLLTDMQMPEMDGYSLVRTLRARGSTLAIVALTAHTLVEDRPSCLEIGCDDYAAKPIDTALLISICAEWLAKTDPRKTGNVPQAERG
jgi:CheY-like chemotaxis protein